MLALLTRVFSVQTVPTQTIPPEPPVYGQVLWPTDHLRHNRQQPPLTTALTEGDSAASPSHSQPLYTSGQCWLARFWVLSRLFCFVLFCFAYNSRCACVGLGTAARAFPTRNKSAVIGAPAPKSLREAPLVQKLSR